jgi:hypothetical protein
MALDRPSRSLPVEQESSKLGELVHRVAASLCVDGAGRAGVFLRVVRRQDACSTARNRGKALCTNKRTIRQDELERIRRSAVKRRGRAVSLLDKSVGPAGLEPAPVSSRLKVP